MLDPPADLGESCSFQRWVVAAVAEKCTSGHLVDRLLAIGTPTAYLRAAQLAYTDNQDELTKQLIQTVLPGLSGLERVLALTVVAECRFREISKEGSNTKLEGVKELTPALESYLEFLHSVPTSTIVLEMQCEVYLALAFAAYLNFDWHIAKSQASRAKLLAEGAGLPVSSARASLFLVNSLSMEGNVIEVHNLAERELANNLPPNVRLTMEYQLGRSLFALGNLERGHQVLSQVIATYPHWPQLRGPLHVIEALIGYVVSDKTTYVQESAWLARGLSYVNQASGLDRTNRKIPRYLELMENAIRELTCKKPLLDEWHIGQMNWALGMVNYRLGRDSLAQSHSLRVPPGLQQEVLVRARRCGLQLDLALSAQLPNLPIEPVEADLRDLFDYVRKIPFGNPEGVGAHLAFWHPTASAYGGIMPNPIPELFPYAQRILQLGKRSAVFGVELSPTLAAELSLRALRVDLDKQLPQAKLNAKDRQRRSELLIERKGIPYWRSPVHPVTLVYGLQKTNSDIHHRVALGITQEYGLSPCANSEYPGLDLANEIGSLGIQLARRDISIAVFSQKFLAKTT